MVVEQLLILKNFGREKTTKKRKGKQNLARGHSVFNLVFKETVMGTLKSFLSTL